MGSNDVEEAALPRPTTIRRRGHQASSLARTQYFDNRVSIDTKIFEHARETVLSSSQVSCAMKLKCQIQAIYVPQGQARSRLSSCRGPTKSSAYS